MRGFEVTRVPTGTLCGGVWRHPKQSDQRIVNVPCVDVQVSWNSQPWASGVWLSRCVACLVSVAVNGFNGYTCYSQPTVSSRLLVTSGYFQLRLSHLDFDTILIVCQTTRSVLLRQELANGELSKIPDLLSKNPELSCGAGVAAAGLHRRRSGGAGPEARRRDPTDGGAVATAAAETQRRRRRSTVGAAVTSDRRRRGDGDAEGYAYCAVAQRKRQRSTGGATAGSDRRKRRHSP